MSEALEPQRTDTFFIANFSVVMGCNLSWEIPSELSNWRLSYHHYRGFFGSFQVLLTSKAFQDRVTFEALPATFKLCSPPLYGGIERGIRPLYIHIFMDGFLKPPLCKFLITTRSSFSPFSMQVTDALLVTDLTQRNDLLNLPKFCFVWIYLSD